ncbi:hypothetical protein MAPG_11212 [Magnaporthiopsis poae ATCC 64411]|uniref:AAA+ ATPase domain-containing protein n=1 Tax=Magnaporthiopsis poae (strain ATCC 64411 / 73-15) TaxID=644358 RepID=A0A0C4EEN8_MAGP6|nr:hypothetical protein MAPG_11212 [Magnaporthiopsis poae ATCC 64411]
MDFDALVSPTIFDQAASFTAFTQQNRPARPVTAYEGAGLKCQLRQFDNVYNSNHERVRLRSGTRYNLDREAGTEHFDAALIETKFWSLLGEPEYTELEIRSPYMKAALKANVPEYRDFNIELRHILLRDKPRCIFHYRNELFKYGQEALKDKPEEQKHVSFLLQHVSQLWSDAIFSYDVFVELAEDGRALLDFPNLWMAFRPGDLVYISERAPCAYGQSLMEFKTMELSCSCDVPMCSSQHKWLLRGYRINFDGEELGYSEAVVGIRAYEGMQYLVDLAAMPLSKHPLRDSIHAKLKALGERSVKLQGRHYSYYRGTAKLAADCVFGSKSSMSINGLVMIDPCTFYELFPDESEFLTPYKPRYKAADLENVHLTGDQYAICDHKVAGFALDEKCWGYFRADLVEDIKFDSQAFKSALILKPRHKKLIHSLVQVHSASGGPQLDDVIQGKGKGVIFLLHGDPGVGKTLTAESVADDCEKPLLRIDASVLGTSADSVERGLSKALQLAEKWGAVALLDEADVFLEARNVSDLERNCLVSVFLRVLEYYQGILFLTTNRIEAFDRAFKSRIHLAIHYPRLDLESRKSIWRTFLAKASVDSTPDLEAPDGALDRWASVELNGRQIRNIIRTGQALALSDGVGGANEHHIDEALKTVREFDLSLKRGVAESDGTSSFTQPDPKRRRIV